MPQTLPVEGPITSVSADPIFILIMASMGRSGRNAPICCSPPVTFSPAFACLPPSHSLGLQCLDSSKIVIAQQTPIAREDLAVSLALEPRGKQCIIRLESFLLSGSLTPDPWANDCALED